MSRANPLEMMLQYPPFLKEVSRDLRLTPEEQHLSAGTRPDVWAYWGVAALAGDEITPFAHKEDAAKWGVPFFAAEDEVRGKPVLDFRAGQLTQRVEAMHASNNPSIRSKFDHLSERVAYWTFLVGATIGLASPEWRSFMPQIPQTMIKPDPSGQRHIRFPRDNQFSFPIEGPTNTIMNFGPGLTGAMQAGELVGHAKEVHFVSGGMGAEYVNRWIGYNLQSMRGGIEDLRREGRLQGMLSDGLDARTVQLPEARYYTDGIAASVGMLSTKSTLDIVLMSAVHSAGVEECHAGIRGAATHLREGGLLVVKAPDLSLGNEAGMDRVAEYAAEKLGDPVAQGPCGELQQHTNPELPVDRAASFAIYQKQ